MQKFLHRIVQSLAAKIIARYQPSIVAVTGSVGKTSAKEMILAILKSHRRCRGTLKSYNNELGLPLSVIGAAAPGRSLFAWIRIIAQALHMSWSHDPTFPEVLVLEMGADHPGDIARLVRIAPPHVGVLTAIAPAHLAFYDSIEAIAQEKITLIRSLSKDGLAILNTDDPIVWQSRTQTQAPVVGVGFSDGADVRAEHIEEFLHNTPEGAVLGGIRGVLVAYGAQTPFTIPNVLGMPQVRALLAAAAVGFYYGLNLTDIVQGLTRYAPPPGRMRLLAGIKKTLIIDDSYNASPQSVVAALETLGRVATQAGVVRYVVLGDMRELGKESAKFHAEMGRLVPAVTDVLVTVGQETEALGREAVAAGLDPARWIKAPDAVAAGKWLQDRIKPGDIILIKGSQNTIRLERAVKEIMAEPLRAKELLARQGVEWESK